MDRVLSLGEGHAALALVSMSHPDGSGCHGEPNGLGGTVDGGGDDVTTVFERASEEAHVGGGVRWIESGNEHRRAEGLGEAGDRVLKGVTGRRDVLGGELERVGAGDERGADVGGGTVAGAGAGDHERQADPEWPSARHRNVSIVVGTPEDTVLASLGGGSQPVAPGRDGPYIPRPQG